ncbi:hypothetical protein BV22DRAFT_540765 [Leucogyrophana mollusca]|uniref:Uncharacterized protein n=1 Tax=Leucogyrophana mollusca TaxID=85980 RepID=A0ACB8BEV5_9AGAM|nr:hypothetical protein BV22DRAFT_540765 [Leucogyrophana mollusca]
MPRLLPRLLQHLRDAPLTDKNTQFKGGYVRYPKRISLKKPLPETPSFSAEHRTRSILLDEHLVSDRRLYDRHKSLPPRVRVHRRRATDNEESSVHDRPREMTDEEREWWSSPYLRMLSSPLRQCVLTRRYLPADFLIRLAPLQLPTSRSARPAQSLLPDGLEHPQFARRKAHTAAYVTCWKDAFQDFKERVPLQRFAPNLSVHALLSTQIGYLLRLRVLQELELLAESLAASVSRNSDATVIRRLTRAEWKAFTTHGTIPDGDPVAMLVVPPLNRNPKTKERPRPSSEPDLQAENRSVDDDSRRIPRFLPQVSTLHPIESIPSVAGTLLSQHLPPSRIPLYNGLALFPFRPQRAVLHAALCRLLLLERKARWKGYGTSQSSEFRTTESQRPRGDEKGSHTFLLCSSKNTIKRADTAALAIALWRLRMWEGGAYQAEGSGEDGWEVGGQWRTEYARRLR